MRRFLSAGSSFVSSVSVTLATTCLAFVAGCGGSNSSSSTGNNDPSTSIAQANVARDTSPTVASTASTALVAGNDDFAFAMYRQLAAEKTGPNVFFSPYSMSLCLSMVYAGAANGTATEMAKALDFTLPTTTLFPAFDQVDLGLASDATNAKDLQGQPLKSTDGQVFTLQVANSLWAETTLPLNAPFLTTLATDYGSGVRLTDFAGDPEGARTDINTWVSGDTNGKITNLLPEGSVTADTKVALVNAIYFNASWETPFDATQTSSAAFATSNGSVKVPTMHASGEIRYASENGVQAAELTYAGETTSMIILLPDAAHAAGFDASLTTASYDSLVGKLSTETVLFSMPKFSFNNGTLSLKSELSTLGMPDAFDAARADFSAMSTTKTFISDVYHQAFISVDETGTEAAAATASIGAGSAAAETPPTMSVDHPFTFVIRDNATGTLLFVGKVTDPS